MKWIDYREKLGIGFNDAHKHKMLSNILKNYVENVINQSYNENSFLNYCQMVGEPYHDYAYSHYLCESLTRCQTIKDLICHYVAFYNTYFPIHPPYCCSRDAVLDNFRKALDSLNITCEVVTDDDGIFLFPKGAKELDDALVSEVLEWLKDYPKAHKTYVIALKQYAEGVYIRDAADNLRKALETFLQEFLENTKNLESNKVEICRYLANKGVDSGISGLFQPLINSYKNINDRIAKHNDAVDEKLLEFLLYQTGILIRMVLAV